MVSKMVSLVPGRLAGQEVRLAGTVIPSTHVEPFPYDGLKVVRLPTWQLLHQSKTSKRPGGR